MDGTNNEPRTKPRTFQRLLLKSEQSLPWIIGARVISPPEDE